MVSPPVIAGNMKLQHRRGPQVKIAPETAPVLAFLPPRGRYQDIPSRCQTVELSPAEFNV